eukprot:CAMPEP_0115400070 /NCGR_PEP_ID=MMETSP0271-20121206/15166_1 /TAXON_ID=71861 /ORGANISM="Scrippsiella trochoidea, Strain CCMP3099" /LENGTH=229 /DNA_ID=CAMNT_0002823909 /DNA_START=65 /DNA_END=755 /DNA_ORIENTATION=+
MGSANCVDDRPSSRVGSGRFGLVGFLLVQGLGAGTGISWSKPVGEQKPLAMGKVRSKVGIVKVHRIGATQPVHLVQISIISGLRGLSHLHHVVGGLNAVGSSSSLNKGTACSGNETSSSALAHTPPTRDHVDSHPDLAHGPAPRTPGAMYLLMAGASKGLRRRCCSSLIVAEFYPRPSPMTHPVLIEAVLLASPQHWTQGLHFETRRWSKSLALLPAQTNAAAQEIESA